MKFYRFAEIPTGRSDQVFKVSPVRCFISFFVAAALFIVPLALAIMGKKRSGVDIPPLLLYFVAAFCSLFGMLTFGQFRASLQPSNWLLRCNSSGIIIKYRSFLNWRFPAEDVQAVAFDYSEIAWARLVKERRAISDLKGSVTFTNTLCLDFCLSTADTSALEAHLQTEQNLQSNGHWLSRDYPVQVVPGGIVQLTWTGGGNGGITASARNAIKYLSRFIKIADSASSKVDLTYDRNATPQDEDAKILLLLKSGDKLAAVRLTRQIYGSSLTEAVAYVDKLQSGNSAGPGA